MAPLNERYVQATGDGVWFYHGNIASPVSGGFVPNPLHFNRPCHSPRRGALVAVQNSGWGKLTPRTAVQMADVRVTAIRK
jgi:hypothetical protein